MDLKTSRLFVRLRCQKLWVFTRILDNPVVSQRWRWGKFLHLLYLCFSIDRSSAYHFHIDLEIHSYMEISARPTPHPGTRRVLLPRRMKQGCTTTRESIHPKGIHPRMSLLLLGPERIYSYFDLSSPLLKIDFVIL